jgi:FMN phosphatase YigB (HAD superfamily)
MGQLLSHWGVHWRVDSFYEGWSEQFAEEVCSGRMDFWASIRGHLLTLGLSRGLCDEILVAGRAKYRLLERGLHPLIGVRETLTTLNACSVSLIAACNVSCSTQEAKERLNSMGLGTKFSLVLASRDLGCTMASPRFFHAALAEARMGADEVALVSNRVAHLCSAQAAGLTTIMLDRDGDFEPDITLDRFAELLDFAATPGLWRKAG